MLHRHETSIALPLRSSGSRSPTGTRAFPWPTRSPGRRAPTRSIPASGTWWPSARSAEPGVDEDRLTAYDDWAHHEAMEAAGLRPLLQGPDHDRRPMHVVLPLGQPDRGPRRGRSAGAHPGRGPDPRGLPELHPRIPPSAPACGRGLHVRAVRRAGRAARARAVPERPARPVAAARLTARPAALTGRRRVRARPPRSVRGPCPAIVRTWRSRRWLPDRSGSTPEPGPIVASWLGRIDYRDGTGAPEAPRGGAGRRRHRRPAAPARAPGGPDPRSHVRPGPHPRRRRRRLAARGIEVVRVERGGEVTYHGPASWWPTRSSRLADARPAGPAARPRPRGGPRRDLRGARRRGRPARRPPGCWCDPDGPDPRKIGALGLRIERGVSYHGIALNVTVDLADFELIDPCGMPGVTSTSIARELRRCRRHADDGLGGARRRASSPTAFAAALGAPLDGVLSAWPPASSSCARTRSPAGGSRRSSTAPSTATGSRAPPSRSTTACSAARTARPRTATASASGCSRTSRSTSSGTDDDARELDRGLGQVALAQARATGSWRTIVAPPGEHRPLHAVGNEMIEALVGGGPRRARRGARGRPDRLPPGRPELGRPGGRPDEPPVPRPVRPAPGPAPDRRGDGRRGPLRDPRRGVPVLPARPRRDRGARTGSSGRTTTSVAFAPVRLALAVRGLDRAASPRGRLRAGHRRRTWPPPPRRSARSSPGWRRASTDRRTTSSSTRRRCASRSTRPTTGTGRSTRACARSPGWSSGPACRSTRSRPRTRSRSSSARSGGQRGRHGLSCVRPGTDRASHGGRSAVFGPTSARRPLTALRDSSRSEYLWSPIPPSLTFATRSAVPPRSDREPAPMSGMWDHEEAGVFVETLFAKHHGEIYAYLLRMLREPELAADLTQDAFIKAYKNYDTLEKPENARAWLYQIAHRVALDEIRRRKIIRFFPWTGESHGSAPVGRAPGHGRPPVGRHAARPRPDPGTPARGPPARRAPRPDRRRAGRRPRRQPRRRAGAPDPRPREPPPGARRRTRRRGRGRGRTRPTRHSPRSVADEPRAPPPPARRPRPPRARARPRPRRRARSTGRSIRVEAAWLDEHLAGCDACRSVAAAYEADRLALRALRDRQPEPPRDLWARTSAAIEREVVGTWRREPARDAVVADGRDPRSASCPGVAVIAVVIGASVLSGGFSHGTRPPRSSRPRAPPAVAHRLDPRARPAPRPIAVGAGSVGWVGTSANGALAYNVRQGRRGLSGRAPARLRRRSSDGDSQPRRPHDPAQVDLAVAGQRTRPSSSATDATGNDAVFVIALPTADADADADPDADADSRPRASTPRPTATAEPTPSVEPSASPSRRRPPRPTPAATPEADAEADRRADARADARCRHRSPRRHRPRRSPTNLAIVSGVKVVGESAAYSPDGAWFAFTARPSDGSAGPDIYVWRVGDDARRGGSPTTTPASSRRGSATGSSAAGRRTRPRVDGRRPRVVLPRSGERQGDRHRRPAAGARSSTRTTTGRSTWDGTVKVDPDSTARRCPATGVARPPRLHAIAAASPPTAPAAVGRRRRRSPSSTSAGTRPARGSRSGSPTRATRRSAGSASSTSTRSTGDLDRPHGAPQDVTGAARASRSPTAVSPGRPRPARTARAAGSRSWPGPTTASGGRERPGRRTSSSSTRPRPAARRPCSRRAIRRMVSVSCDPAGWS